MCGLCGLWGETSHWTSIATAPGAQSEAARRLPARARAQQQASIERIGTRIGVSVRDWSGSSWIVSNASGASEIVGSLPAVWAAAEALSGKRIDPLAFASAPAGASQCR